MKKVLIIVLACSFALPALAQERRRQERVRTDGFYVHLGVARGPSFGDFFDYVNNTYGDLFQNHSQNLTKFGKNVMFDIGYISRFHRNFALDVGFMLYGLSSNGKIENNDQNPTNPLYFVRHDLQYQVGVFSATLPIIFEFSPRQRLVPYVGIGISIFAMRLDDFRDDGLISEALRDSRTSVGGHFEAGVGFKMTQRLWLDLRGRWYDGTGHLSTLEENLRDFTVKQDISQIGLGIDYFFR